MVPKETQFQSSSLSTVHKLFKMFAARRKGMKYNKGCYCICFIFDVRGACALVIFDIMKHELVFFDSLNYRTKRRIFYLIKPICFFIL